MSYARFGCEGSDVYLYLGDGGFVCCGCRIGDRYDFQTAREMVAHLEEHRAKGHVVPQSAIDEIIADDEAHAP